MFSSGLKVALYVSVAVLCIISSNAFLRPPQRLIMKSTFHKTSVLPQSSHIVLRAAPEEQKPEGPPKKKAPPSSGLSEGMREKLLRETRSSDPNVSNGNPIFVIGLIIALLVLLGGQGFFF